MMDDYQALLSHLRQIGPCGVCFSGGTDSALLLYAASQALGDQTAAMTAVLRSVPAVERAGAQTFCDQYGIRQIEVVVDELQIPGYPENPVDRCYLCKQELLLQLSQSCPYPVLVEGSNASDVSDYRPGARAVREAGVLSPFQALGLTKDRIRELSQALGLPTWDKPAAPCLASRIPYGEEITARKLSQIEAGEALLKTLGFSQLRLRCHGSLARIEVPAGQMGALLEKRDRIIPALKTLGFSYISLDLEGFHSGSLNRVLK